MGHEELEKMAHELSLLWHGNKGKKKEIEEDAEAVLQWLEEKAPAWGDNPPTVIDLAMELLELAAEDMGRNRKMQEGAGGRNRA